MGEEIGEGGYGIGGEPDGAEDRSGVEAEGAAGGEAGGVDAAEGDNLGAARKGERGTQGLVVEGGTVAGLGEGGENRGEEEALRDGEERAEGREVVAGAAEERKSVTKLVTLFRVVETADGELGGEFVVAVEDDARVKLGRDGVEVRGEAGTVPGRLAQVVVREAEREEARERGEFALVVVFGGDEEELHEI